MKIGNWELRKPWVKYVEVELEEQFYNEIRKSIGEDIAKEIEIKANETYYDEKEIWIEAAAIARGNK